MQNGTMSRLMWWKLLMLVKREQHREKMNAIIHIALVWVD